MSEFLYVVFLSFGVAYVLRGSARAFLIRRERFLTNFTPENAYNIITGYCPVGALYAPIVLQAIMIYDSM
ncbi:MAG: hypothetical protein ACETVQ_03190 [Candidatus Bathyarchaeia archaeon]